ncbi:interferon-induced protein 44-like isoform X2 [Molossus molossus]|uniref:Interferon-induced protein 44-like n=1 Tax=Molossus molossus TaxID=27622 RepID=A0A7J8F8T6_MOLMO|nr:interferon-induced protein 44-like isoform X2 [Molossus molossus]KAF6443985.1 interferon induced protein 44 like [Molossus molossus]
MAVTTRLTWNEEKGLQRLLGNVSLSLLYKSSVHGCSIKDMLERCTLQGSTVTVIYLDKIIIGAFILGHYPQEDRDFEKQTSSFHFLFKKNTTEITTAFLNTAPKITSEELTFYSSGYNKIFSLTPHKCHFFLATLLAKILKVRPGVFGYLECEVFRVEGIKDDGGYIRRITGATERRSTLLAELRNYKPYADLVSEIHILLLGPVGSGKSSFINSVKSVFRGHMTRQAAVGSDITSITELYRIYSIKDGKDGTSLPFMLCDTMGLDEKEGVGLCVDDIPHILKGCMPDRYHFNPQKPITSRHPNFTSPSLGDRIHCVAYVLDINCINNLTSEMVVKLKQVKEEVLNSGVAQVALLTKVENYHEVLQDNFLNMKKSVTSQSQIMEVQKILNIPIYNILLVDNYASDWEPDPLKDILILSVLKQMLQAVDDYLEDLPPQRTASN